MSKIKLKARIKTGLEKHDIKLIDFERGVVLLMGSANPYNFNQVDITMGIEGAVQLETVK